VRIPSYILFETVVWSLFTLFVVTVFTVTYWQGGPRIRYRPQEAPWCGYGTTIRVERGKVRYSKASLMCWGPEGAVPADR